MPKTGVLPIRLPNVLDLRCERFGVAGAVREEDAVGLEGEHIFGGSERGHHRHVAAGVDEAAKDVVLDAEVVGDDVKLRVGGLRSVVRMASRVRPYASIRNGSAW